MKDNRVVILGAGPAGLAAAWQLRRRGKASAIVLEQRSAVGGNAGSFELAGLPVDFGSHRLHPACDPGILADLRTLLGGDLRQRPRHGRIRLCGRWIHFPLKAPELLRCLPWSFRRGVAADTAGRLVRRRPPPEPLTFATALEHGLGKTICREFYFPYAAKIWGVSAGELSAEQARRRVSAASPYKMLRKALPSFFGSSSAAAGRSFFYPRSGYGQISDALSRAARAAGADIQLGAPARRVHRGAPHRIEIEHDGAPRVIEAEHVWSTIPLTALIRLLTPAAPAEVVAASERITYRAMVLIYIVLAQPQFTPYDAHYFPESGIRLTRLSEPKNYSGRADPPDRTVLCGELPCAAGDAVWRAADEELADLMRTSLAQCGLEIRAPIVQVVTKRLPCAYPIYRLGYERHFQKLDDWVAGLENVLTFGRQGLFAHDNTHHTLAMAYAAVECLRPDGKLDAARWREYRREFEAHVVED